MGESVPHEGLERAIRNVDVIVAKDTNIYEQLRRSRVILDLKFVQFFDALLKMDISTRESSETIVAHDLMENTPSLEARTVVS